MIEIFGYLIVIIVVGLFAGMTLAGLGMFIVGFLYAIVAPILHMFKVGK